ncbi:MAG: hypothetical protein IKP61_10710 [Spirochaetales bacterium]|nr:hypothetical protein [Spirochaetales bacterium]
MKKIALVLLVILFSLVPVFAETVYAPIAQYMLGHVDALVEFGIEILEDVLPFDLDGADIVYNPNPNTVVSGLQIGTYSVVANSRQFDIYITHTPLSLITAPVQGDTGTLDSIDYQLYIVLNYHAGLFGHCLSNGNVQISGDNYSIWAENEPMLIVREGLFVSLDDGNGTTANSVLNLKSGTYRSTISFELWGR